MSSDSPSAADLSLATIDELVEELRNRCDGCLIVCEMRAKIAGASDGETLIAYVGSPAYVMGMAEYAKARMIHRSTQCYNDGDNTT